jgi:hypothetical protein
LERRMGIAAVSSATGHLLRCGHEVQAPEGHALVTEKRPGPSVRAFASTTGFVCVYLRR